LFHPLMTGSGKTSYGSCSLTQELRFLPNLNNPMPAVSY
jgi:hypothetical protein